MKMKLEYHGARTWVMVATMYDPNACSFSMEEYVIRKALSFLSNPSSWGVLDADSVDAVQVLTDVYYALRSMEFCSLYLDSLNFEGPTADSVSAAKTEQETR